MPADPPPQCRRRAEVGRARARHAAHPGSWLLSLDLLQEFAHHERGLREASRIPCSRVSARAAAIRKQAQQLAADAARRGSALRTHSTGRLLAYQRRGHRTVPHPSATVRATTSFEPAATPSPAPASSAATAATTLASRRQCAASLLRVRRHRARRSFTNPNPDGSASVDVSPKSAEAPRRSVTPAMDLAGAVWAAWRPLMRPASRWAISLRTHDRALAQVALGRASDLRVTERRCPGP